MNIFFEKNLEDSTGKIPYMIGTEITSLTIDTDTTFRVPVYLSKNGRSKYNSELCGFRVEAETIEGLIPLVEKLIRGLVNMARLPTYIFIARRSRQMYPVYTYGDEVLATTPGGPVFRHVELAKVRDYLSDYLHAVGELGTPGKSEKLHVRGVNRESLALIRPIFYLKKRAQEPDENEFWAPVFMADDEGSIYTYAASGKREVDMAGGYEALLLRSQVAQALIADHRLKEDYALRLDRLLPEYWQRVQATLTPQAGKLRCNGLELNLYQAGRFMVACEHRLDEDRYSLYLGQNTEDLRSRTTRDLARRGVIGAEESVQMIH